MMGVFSFPAFGKPAKACQMRFLSRWSNRYVSSPSTPSRLPPPLSVSCRSVGDPLAKKPQSLCFSLLSRRSLAQAEEVFPLASSPFLVFGCRRSSTTVSLQSRLQVRRSGRRQPKRIAVENPQSSGGEQKTSGVRRKKETQEALSVTPQKSERDAAIPPSKLSPSRLASSQTVQTGSSANSSLQTGSSATPPSPVPAGRGFLGVVAEGIAHGVGWAFGQRAVEALLGPRTMEVVHNNNNDNEQTPADSSNSASGYDTSPPSHDASGSSSSSSYPEEQSASAEGEEQDGWGGGWADWGSPSDWTFGDDDDV